VNYIEVPKELTGVKARIFMLVGKWFPTGCHKVGATFGCLVPRLITGQFDPTFNKRFGRAPVTIAAAALITPFCWRAIPSRFCPRR
jgi:hypothetical protein